MDRAARRPRQPRSPRAGHLATRRTPHAEGLFSEEPACFPAGSPQGSQAGNGPPDQPQVRPARASLRDRGRVRAISSYASLLGRALSVQKREKLLVSRRPSLEPAPTPPAARPRPLLLALAGAPGSLPFSSGRGAMCSFQPSATDTISSSRTRCAHRPMPGLGTAAPANALCRACGRTS